MSSGIYKKYKIIFFCGDFDKILSIYNSPEESITRFMYIEKSVQEVFIQEIEENDDVLVIDYGTSYTTAGTYVDGRIKHVWFYSDDMCEKSRDTPTRIADCVGCGRCALCPSVIAVRSCNGDDIELLFGHEAVDRVPIAKNSIFFDTKRWVNNYTEVIDIKDLDGNTSFMQEVK